MMDSSKVVPVDHDGIHRVNHKIKTILGTSTHSIRLMYAIASSSLTIRYR